MPSGKLVLDLLETSLEDELIKIHNSNNDDTAKNHSAVDDASNDFWKLIGDNGGEDVKERLPIGVTKTSFLSSDWVGYPAKDIGPGTEGPGRQFTGVIGYDEQKVLSEIYEVIGGNQITRKKLDFETLWVLAKAVESEVKFNWIGAYTEIRKKYGP